MEDRVSDLRSRWTPEATAAAVAFLESRPSGSYDLPTMEQGGVTYLDLRGLRIEGTQVDKAFLKNVNLRWALFRDVGFKNARFVNCNLSQVQFQGCYLRRAQFEKCDIVNSHFEDCDFSQAAIVESRVDFASFKNCAIGMENLRFPRDTAPRAMVRICRSLKLNAMSMGNFADAGQLTYLEKSHERRGFAQEGAWARWAGSALQNLLWGYGEKPWRLAAFMVLGIVLFSAGHGVLATQGAASQVLMLLEAALGIGAFAMLVASVTKKVMYR